VKRFVDLRRSRRLTVKEAELVVELLLKRDIPAADRIIAKIKPAIAEAASPLTAAAEHIRKMRAKLFLEALAKGPVRRKREIPAPLPFSTDGGAA
jgi:hypothetical protein